MKELKIGQLIVATADIEDINIVKFAAVAGDVGVIDRVVAKNGFTAMFPRTGGQGGPEEGEYEVIDLHPDIQHIINYFVEFDDVPRYLIKVSTGFALVAFTLASTHPKNPEVIVALRKLLESRDAAFRCHSTKTVL